MVKTCMPMYVCFTNACYAYVGTYYSLLPVLNLS